MTTYPISFRIEPRHIEGAVRCDSRCCPIARALAESVGADIVEATQEGVQFRLPASQYVHESEQDKRWRNVLVTEEAAHFMLDFDRGDSVEPFTFTSTFTI